MHTLQKNDIEFEAEIKVIYLSTVEIQLKIIRTAINHF